MQLQRAKFLKRALLLAVFCAAGVPVAHAVTINANVTTKSDFSVTGSISKGSGTFAIDHPLDPANKLLYHSFVESPDALNIYVGTAQLDEFGAAIVMLPAYFEALNISFTYQFFPYGEPMPNLHVVREIRGNSFEIAGGVPFGEISWMVTGIRHDPFMRAHPIIPVVKKSDVTVVRKGECLFAPACK